MFNKEQLKRLILPLIIEQLLAVLVGMADVMMVSQAGQSATSGVSLVDIVNQLLILVFSSLATGGAIVSSHYLGQKKEDMACKSANQLILSMLVIGASLLVLCLIGNRFILQLIYGDVDAEVMNNAVLYFAITALSYPFLAMYSGAAAICRSMGDSKISMKVSVIMNIINVTGNAICILGLHMGVAGVAIPTLISRIAAAVLMFFVIRNQSRLIHIDPRFHLGFDWQMIKEILKIGVPTGIDGGLFQLGKILVASLVSTLGTSAIAANAVGNTLASFQVIPGSAMGLALTTIVGQCLGAKEKEQAFMYTRKLIRYAYMAMSVLNILMLISLPLVLQLYNLESDAFNMAYIIMMIHGISAILIWPLSFTLPASLRAGGDARFVMIVSVASMWTFRICCSYLFVLVFHWGLPGVWASMIIDWICRSICFEVRFRKRKWMKL